MKKAIFGLIILSVFSLSTFAGGEKNNKNTNNVPKRISVSGYVEDFESSEKLVCVKIEILELDKPYTLISLVIRALKILNPAPTP